MINDNLITGSKVFLRFLEASDAPAMLNFYLENRDFLAPWEPARSSDFFTLENMRGTIESARALIDSDRGYPFVIGLRSTGEFAGRINLNNLVRGVFQSASLGYSVGQKYNGQGIASEAVRLALNYAFNYLNLHRVEAGTLTNNYGSQRVLEKNGFRREGHAQRYLKINGIWQDHYIFAITAEERNSI